MEQGFRRAKRGRATGLDCLPDDILAALPEELARIWHPLLAKVTARIQEPLSFKGGRFAELFKGSGDQRRCEAYRSIFLSNGIAKQYHRLLRGRLLPFLEAYSPEVVCALKGRGTDVGAHYIRLAQEYAAAQRLCCAVVYFDIKAAYYTVVRELAVGGVDDEAIVRLIARLGLPPPRPMSWRATWGRWPRWRTRGSRCTSRPSWPRR